jgi:hypothetical protein
MALRVKQAKANTTGSNGEALHTGYREQLVVTGTGGYKPSHNNDSEASSSSANRAQIVPFSLPGTN